MYIDDDPCEVLKMTDTSFRVNRSSPVWRTSNGWHALARSMVDTFSFKRMKATHRSSARLPKEIRLRREASANSISISTFIPRSRCPNRSFTRSSNGLVVNAPKLEFVSDAYYHFTTNCRLPVDAKSQNERLTLNDIFIEGNFPSSCSIHQGPNLLP